MEMDINLIHIFGTLFKNMVGMDSHVKLLKITKQGKKLNKKKSIILKNMILQTIQKDIIFKEVVIYHIDQQ